MNAFCKSAHSSQPQFYSEVEAGRGHQLQESSRSGPVHLSLSLLADSHPTPQCPQKNHVPLEMHIQKSLFNVICVLHKDHCAIGTGNANLRASGLTKPSEHAVSPNGSCSHGVETHMAPQPQGTTTWTDAGFISGLQGGIQHGSHGVAEHEADVL